MNCIQHGQLIDDPTAHLLADKSVWWNLQPLIYDAGAFARMTPVSRQKALKVFSGTESAYRLAKKYSIKTAFGTEIPLDAGAAAPQGRILPSWSAGIRPIRTIAPKANDTHVRPIAQVSFLRATRR